MTSDERLPRPSDYATFARYFAAVMGWLEYRLPGEENRIRRAQAWRAIESKEWNLMPVKRTTKAAVESPLARAAREEFAAMTARAGYDPDAPALRARRAKRAAKLDRVIEKRLRKHPDESRADAALAIILKRAAKEQARIDAEEAEEDAAEEAAAALRRQQAVKAAAARNEAPTDRRAPLGPAPAATETPRRKAPRVSVSHLYLD